MDVRAEISYPSLLKETDISENKALVTILYHQQKGPRLLLEAVESSKKEKTETLYSFTRYKDGYLINSVETVDEEEIKGSHFLSYPLNQELFTEFTRAVDKRLNEIAEESDEESDDKINKKTKKLLSNAITAVNARFFNAYAKVEAVEKKALKKMIKEHVSGYMALVNLLEDVLNEEKFPHGLEQFKYASPVFERPQVGMKL